MATPSSRKGPASANPKSHSPSKRCKLPGRSSRCGSKLQNKTVRPQSATKPNVNRLKPAKSTRNRVPPPQQQRIIQKFVAGESITQIAREVNRNRETVSRIVNGDEVRELVQRMRAELYDLAYAAIDAVRHGLQLEKDWRLGYRLLTDIGVIPLPAMAEVNAIQAGQSDQEELTPYERASAQDEFGRINPVQLAMVRIGKERNAMFGRSLPTAEEIWRNRTVAALIDEITRGQTLTISLSNPSEWTRLKGLAEDILQGKRAITDKEIVAVREKYGESS